MQRGVKKIRKARWAGYRRRPAQLQPLSNDPSRRAQPGRQGHKNGLRTERVRQLFSTKAFIVPVSLAILGGASGGVVTYILAGNQEIRAHRSIEADHKAQDSRVAAVRIENVEPHNLLSYSSKETVNLEGKPYEGLDQILAGHERRHVGEIVMDEPVTSPQPLVHLTIDFTLVGQHYTPVQVVDIRARVVSREQPPSGTLVYLAPQGGDPALRVGFNLDSTDLEGRVTDGARPTTRRYLSDNYVTAARDERVGFSAEAFTMRCLCTFVIDIKLSDGSTVTVDDNGAPWQLSGFAPSYARAYIPDMLTGGNPFKSCVWPEGCLLYY